MQASEDLSTGFQQGMALPWRYADRSDSVDLCKGGRRLTSR
jgi:hypothetical protein